MFRASGTGMSTHAPIYDLGQDRPHARIGIYLSPIFAVFGVMALVIWGATEWVAWRFRFHPNLGAPVFDASPTGRVLILSAAGVLAMLLVASVRVEPLRRVVGTLAAFLVMAIAAAFLPVYAPWAVWVWDWNFCDAPRAKLIFEVAENAIIIPAHLLFVVAMYVAWRRARRNARSTDAHGSARWASAEEVAAAELLGGEGLFLGVFKKRALEHGAYLRHHRPQHVLGCAPTRSGKGVGWVIPTLLTWRGSVLVHDIKGENWARTAGWRSAELGSRCLKFDPTCRDGSGARYNPVLEVRRGPEEVRDAQNIADMLVDPDGHGVKDHWDITAQEVLLGAILHVLYVGRDKSLRGCLDLLTSPHARIENVLSEMLSTEHDPEGRMSWIDRSTGALTRTHPVVAGAARSLLNKSENERSSVISSAVKCLSLFRNEVVAANTATCDFAIEDLVHHESPVSLYLVVPPSDVSRTRPLIRLLINQIGRRLTEGLNPQEGEGADARRRLLFMMDEFPTLGRLDFFQTQLAYLAGYGIQAFLIVQDLSRLYAADPRGAWSRAGRRNCWRLCCRAPTRRREDADSSTTAPRRRRSTTCSRSHAGCSAPRGSSRRRQPSRAIPTGFRICARSVRPMSGATRSRRCAPRTATSPVQRACSGSGAAGFSTGSGSTGCSRVGKGLGEGGRPPGREASPSGSVSAAAGCGPSFTRALRAAWDCGTKRALALAAEIR